MLSDVAGRHGARGQDQARAVRAGRHVFGAADLVAFHPAPLPGNGVGFEAALRIRLQEGLRLVLEVVFILLGREQHRALEAEVPFLDPVQEGVGEELQALVLDV